MPRARGCVTPKFGFDLGDSFTTLGLRLVSQALDERRTIFLRHDSPFRLKNPLSVQSVGIERTVAFLRRDGVDSSGRAGKQRHDDTLHN
jgi:hypothetical protein